MNKNRKILAVLMTLMITFTFMPSFAFAGDMDDVNSPENDAQLVAQEDVAEETSEGDTYMQPEELRVYDPDGNYVEDCENFLKENKISHPTEVKFMPSSGVSIQAEYLATSLKFGSFYCEGNEIDVVYSGGSTDKYICTEYDYYPDGDTSKTWGDFGTMAVSSEAVFLPGTENAMVVYYESVQVGEDEYVVLKASQAFAVELVKAEAFALVKDTNGDYWGTYDGTRKSIDKDNIDFYPSYGEWPNITDVSVIGDMKSIGTNTVQITIDNSDEYFESDVVEDYYNIYPVAVTGVKASNTKKNTIKASWKYNDKTNYNEIDGYLVSVYDSNYNFITEKKVKKSKTSVTLKSKKLKKGKKYSVEIAAYKDVDGSDYRSETIEKIVKVKK